MIAATRYVSHAVPTPAPRRHRAGATGRWSTDMDDSRTNIVQPITERVARGEYVVDTDKVATAILSRLLAAQAAEARTSH